MSLEEDLLHQARETALRRRTTLTRMVREFLKDVVTRENGRGRDIQALSRWMRRKPAHVGKRRWRREEIYRIA